MGGEGLIGVDFDPQPCTLPELVGAAILKCSGKKKRKIKGHVQTQRKKIFFFYSRKDFSRDTGGGGEKKKIPQNSGEQKRTK